MTAILDVLYAVCDLLFGWTSLFGATAALTVVGVLSGLAVILFQKYASDQDLLGRCKEDLKILKARMKPRWSERTLSGARRFASSGQRSRGTALETSVPIPPSPTRGVPLESRSRNRVDTARPVYAGGSRKRRADSGEK